RLVDALHLQITGEERAALASRRPVNPEAHAAYLEGRFWWNKRTPDGLEQAIELFGKAIEIDPQYALAYSGQAETYAMMGIYSHRPHDVHPKALAAANRAIELNPTLAAPHAALGMYYLLYDWDWDAAETANRRAIELDPTNATAHHWFEVYLVFLGRCEEAKPYIERAAALEPSSLIIQRDRGNPALFGRQFEEARRYYEAALAMNPDFAATAAFLGEALLSLGRTDEAIMQFRLAVLREDAGANSLGALGRAYGLAGQREEALDELQRLTGLSDSRYVPFSAFAEVHLGLGNLDEVFALLDRAFDERESCIAWIKFHPAFDAARHDPRFDALLKKVGFPANPPAPKIDPIEIPVPVIAVLPFEMSGVDADAAYLADEIPASIIDSLSNLSGVHTIPRSSAFRHRDSTDTIQQIGQALGADYILTGQIVPRGNDLRIRAELVSVRTNRQVWSNRLDRSLADTLAVETEITGQIVEALVLPVTGDESQQLADRRPVSDEAHAAYLKGRFWWKKRTAEGFAKAIEQFEQALALDPNYTLAYLGLADTYNLMSVYTHDPREVMPKAVTAIYRVFQLNPNLAEAHASRGWLNMSWHLDWASAERDYQECIRRNPRFATGHHWYAWMLFGQGRLDQALAEIEVAHQLDPGSAIINTDFGFMYIQAGQFEQARTRLEETREMSPDFPKVLVMLSLLDSLAGRLDDAIARMQMMKALGLLYANISGDLGVYLAKAGREAEARQELEALLLRRQSEYVPAFEIACIYDALGEPDEAMNWLETAFEERSTGLSLASGQNGWNDLRATPRFQDLARRLGVDPDWITPGVRLSDQEDD
ncbi:MAG: tetratricopeptide repeat protein, partial [Proteobacteria bacterium]|nr:tetratricopeptide repeat protein [Pseudomonadota bacterium]